MVRYYSDGEGPPPQRTFHPPEEDLRRRQQAADLLQKMAEIYDAETGKVDSEWTGKQNANRQIGAYLAEIKAQNTIADDVVTHVTNLFEDAKKYAAVQGTGLRRAVQFEAITRKLPHIGTLRAPAER